MKAQYIKDINEILLTLSNTMLKAILCTLKNLPNKCLHFNYTSSIITNCNREVVYVKDYEELVELLAQVDTKYYSYLKKLLKEFKKKED